MINRESDFNKIVETAYNHTIEELGLEEIKLSLKTEYDDIQKAHDSIHEFMFLAGRIVPNNVSNEEEWHKKSAFLLYHWEVFNYAHRSFIEALCAYYNIAFVLLRVTLELLLKGALWECLSHKAFREESKILDKDPRGKKIKEWLNSGFESDPNLEIVFEKISASIYDRIGPIMDDPKYRLDTKIIIRQLNQWGIFDPITDPELLIYDGIYKRLSLDVHAIPDRTDIGKRLIAETDEFFNQAVSQEELKKFVFDLHRIMDLAIVIELNILKDGIENYDEVKTNLRERLETLERLGLYYSPKKVKDLLNSCERKYMV